MKKNTIFFIGLMSLFISLQAQFTYDAQAVYPLVPSEYSQTPLSQVISLNLSANVENKGTSNITNVKLGVDVLKDGLFVTSLQSSNTIATILPNAANSFSISYLPASGAGLYTFKYYPILSQSDQSAANDTSVTTYNVSISDYTRHIGTAVDGYGIGTGDGDALIGSLFTVNNAKLLDKIKVDLFAPLAGTNVKARIYATTNGVPNSPTMPLWESDVVTIFAAGAQSINFFSSNMPTLSPGTYWFGCLEMDNGMSIATHTDIFTPNRQYVYWGNVPGGTWVTLESQTPVNSTLAITPVFDLACTPGASPMVAITGSANDSIIVCNGTPVTLTTSATGVSEYRWFRNDTLISSVNGGNGSLVVNAGKMESGTDIYTLKVLYTAVQCLSAPSVALKVKNYVPLATITTIGAATFCEIKPAPTTILTANEGMGYTYVWKLAGNTVQSSGITHTPVSSGAYTVVVTDPQGCSNTSAPTNITILSHPAAPSIAITGSTTNTISVCSNVNVVLNSVSGGGTMTEYVWHKNGASLVYYNGGTGKYTANSGYGPLTDTYNLEVAYAGNQCISLMSAPISVVNISPVTTLNQVGNVTVCPGVIMPLTVTNPLASYIYTWKKANTIVQVGGTSYTPTTSGNYTVTIKDNATNCTKVSLPTVFTISTLPTANAGLDKSLCFGESVAIGTAAVPTNTYTWSPSAGLSDPFTAMPNASPTTSTATYTVTVKNAAGCSKTDAMVVTNLPLPATPSLAASATNVCQGTNITLTPTSVGAANLNWYKNGILQYNKATTFSQVVNTPSASADNYTVKAKGANGCLSSFSNYQNVWVKEAAVPTITSTPAGVGTTITVCVPGGTSGSAVLTANSTTALASYSWRVGATFVAGANSSTYTQVVTPTSNNKVVRVQATYPNGCVQTSATRTVTLVTTGCVPKLGDDKEGANDLIDASLSVGLYPNPTNEKLQVAIANSPDNEGKLLVYNNLGQTVLAQSISLINGEANIELDLSQLAAGVYSLSFQTATSNKVQKIVKE